MRREEQAAKAKMRRLLTVLDREDDAEDGRKPSRPNHISTRSVADSEEICDLLAALKAWAFEAVESTDFREAAVVDAAVAWAYCPMEGGYRDGRSVEDLCESLAHAVESLVGQSTYDHVPWWTEEEAMAHLGRGWQMDDEHDEQH